jgi:aminotransferase EvaB
MRIQVWDYREELEAEHPQILDAINRVLRSGRLILGESVAGFEAEFAAYCGARFGVGVNSGTDALMLGLLALGVAPGDEVITVANTAIPTVSAIVSAGATPRFVDIEPRTYLMDTSQLERAITPRTRCIIPVHLFGQCVDMDGVSAVAQKHGLKVLEDCAQAHGAVFKGRIAGSMGDAAAFSFYPTKILGGYGDGGMVLTSSEPVAARVRRLRMYGTERTYFSIEHGYNSRLDELHAEILRVKLRHLDEYIARRRELAARYDEKLAGCDLTLPSSAPGNTHAFYLYVVRHRDRDRLLAELARLEVFVNVSYPWPIHTMPAYAHLGYTIGDLPHTEAAAREIFSLPIYPGLKDQQQDLACDRLLSLLGRTSPAPA